MIAREILVVAWATPEAFGFDPPDEDDEDPNGCESDDLPECEVGVDAPSPPLGALRGRPLRTSAPASLCEEHFERCAATASRCPCEGRPIEGWCERCGASVAGWRRDDRAWDLTWHRAFETLVRQRLEHFGAQIDLRFSDCDRVGVNWYETLEERDRLCDEVLRIVDEVRAELRAFGPEAVADPPGVDPAQLVFSWVA